MNIRNIKGSKILFLIPYQMFTMLLIQILGRFIGWTLLSIIWPTVKFEELFIGIVELIII